MTNGQIHFLVFPQRDDSPTDTNTGESRRRPRTKNHAPSRWFPQISASTSCEDPILSPLRPALLAARLALTCCVLARPPSPCEAYHLLPPPLYLPSLRTPPSRALLASSSRRAGARNHRCAGHPTQARASPFAPRQLFFFCVFFWMQKVPPLAWRAAMCEAASQESRALVSDTGADRHGPRPPTHYSSVGHAPSVYRTSILPRSVGHSASHPHLITPKPGPGQTRDQTLGGTGFEPMDAARTHTAGGKAQHLSAGSLCVRERARAHERGKTRNSARTNSLPMSACVCMMLGVGVHVVCLSVGTRTNSLPSSVASSHVSPSSFIMAKRFACASVVCMRVCARGATRRTSLPSVSCSYPPRLRHSTQDPCVTIAGIGRQRVCVGGCVGGCVRASWRYRRQAANLAPARPRPSPPRPPHLPS